jgi:hypothetical protein
VGVVGASQCGQGEQEREDQPETSHAARNDTPPMSMIDVNDEIST